MNITQKESKIRVLIDQIFILNKRILFTEKLNIDENILKPLKNQMEDLETELDKLESL